MDKKKRDTKGKIDKLFELYGNYIVPTYTPELILIRGEGSYVWDMNNNQYLDFGCGIGVCNLGHSHPKVVNAACKQAKNLVHISNLYMNPVQPILASKICKQGFEGKVFFANSGAEVNEAMIKFARKWGNQQGKYEIITMEDSFHGRTLATLAATGQTKYRKGFDPEVTGFKHVPFNDIKTLKKAVTKKTAAIMLEPIQGEGGVIPADAEYLKEVRELCDEKEILLLFDEVQCGMGRTGKFFAFQNYNVVPDALTLAKALGNGFPIGALLIKAKYGDILTSGTHASTFGGNPVSCSAAVVVIDVINEERLLDHVREISEKFFNTLYEMKSKYPFIKDVRGKGLMIGVEVSDKKLAQKAVAIMQKKGLLALTAGENVIRFLPPLTITWKQYFRGIQIINDTFSDIKSTDFSEN